TRDAKDPGSDQIRVTGRREGAVVLIQVSDTGPGLSEKARAHLFEAFQGSTRTGSVGLGLAILAHLVPPHAAPLPLLQAPIRAPPSPPPPRPARAIRHPAAASAQGREGGLALTPPVGVNLNGVSPGAAALQTRDRSNPWLSRISGAIARRRRASTRFWLHFVTRCAAYSGTLGRVRGHIHRFKRPVSFPRRDFCVRVLHLCFTNPRMRVGGAPRVVRVLGGTPVRRTHNAARQAPSEAPCVP